MTHYNCEVAIIGSSFAGSLLAMCLRRQGIDVILLDRQKHPRFALGESSTPAADLVLAALCERYDLPRLKPLTRYGSWKRTYPDLRCGPKRGFSYFHHRPGEPFVPDTEHANELLVTASAADEVSDTNWYRADVDAFFAAEAEAAGALLLQETRIAEFNRTTQWTLSGVHQGHSFELQASFLIDSSGLSAVLPQRLALSDRSNEFQTCSRSIYAHLSGVRRWRDILAGSGARVDDHPFDCDAAALHHIMDGAWMWVLPFDGDVTSAGLVLGPGHSHSSDISPARKWQSCLAKHPSIDEQFAAAELLSPFRDFVSTGRLQRFWDVPPDASRLGWSLLPGTHGFIDAFFSTGIAHSMIGIERVASAFEARDDDEQFHSRMQAHVELTARELLLIDRLVAASHAACGHHPELLANMTMLYFAAATTWEQRRGTGRSGGGFLLADDPVFTRLVDESVDDLHRLLGRPEIQPEERRDLSNAVAERIAPYNSVGLCDAAAGNMYRYTAAEKDGR